MTQQLKETRRGLPRRCQRVSLRVALLVLTLLALGFGWIADQAHQQRRLVDAVRAKNGPLFYEWRFDPQGNSIPEDRVQLPGPEWLREALGEEYFGDVCYVSAHDFDDADLRLLEGVPHLRTLRLWSPRVADSRLLPLRELHSLTNLRLSRVDVTEESLETIGKLSGLRSLTLSYCRVDGTGLKHLEKCRRLRVLDLRGSTRAGGRVQLPVLPELQSLNLGELAMNDHELASLAEQPALRMLSLSSADIGDAELARIAELSSLESLGLTGSRVTDDGLRHLRQLKNLKRLDLYRSEISDHGVFHLVFLPNLTSLDLSYSHISDLSLPTLARVGSLKRLRIHGTHITSEGARKLDLQYDIEKVLWNNRSDLKWRSSN